MSNPVTIHDFRSDPLFPRIERAVAAILVDGKVVAPVDVLVRMDVLAPSDLEEWRFGRVLYLERARRFIRLSRLAPFSAMRMSPAPSTRRAGERWPVSGLHAYLASSSSRGVGAPATERPCPCATGLRR